MKDDNSEFVKMNVYENGNKVGVVTINKKVVIACILVHGHNIFILGPKGKEIWKGVKKIALTSALATALGVAVYSQVSGHVENDRLMEIGYQLGENENFDKQILDFIKDSLEKLKLEKPGTYADSIEAIEGYLISIDYYQKHPGNEVSLISCVKSCLEILDRAGINYKGDIKTL